MKALFIGANLKQITTASIITLVIYGITTDGLKEGGNALILFKASLTAPIL
jgi:hypothetical protein